MILILFTIACPKKPPSNPNPTPLPQNPILNSAENVTVSGQSVTLTNNSMSLTDGFYISFSNVGNLTCDDVSIVTREAYGFVPNGSVFLPSSPTNTMPQYSCGRNGSDIVLYSAPPLQEGFRPWVDNFNISFRSTFGSTTFTVTVNTPTSASQLLTRGAQSTMNLDSSFTGCGLRGTVLQRVYNCSKKIINYAVYISSTNSTSNSSTTNLNGTSSYYTLFTGSNPELYWFVVSCPSGNGSTVPQQSCTWLTPIVPAGNPALDSMGSGANPTFQLPLLTGYQKRLLWSGKMIRDGMGYKFTVANGFILDAAQEYSADIGNPGQIPSTAQPTPSPASVCNAASGASLREGTFPASDATVRDIVSLPSGATIIWQMPSYAMINILTGGTPTHTSGVSACPASGALFARPSCDMSAAANVDNKGFSAINVPGFSQTDIPAQTACFPSNCLEFMWSSSKSSSPFQSWAFIALSTSQNGGLVDDFSAQFLRFVTAAESRFGVRCISLAWY